MFLHLSVILFTGQGACVVKGGICGKLQKGGGMYGEGEAYMARGHVWQVWHAWKGGMHAGEMATEAGGTLSTGMHSCYDINLKHCVYNFFVMRRKFYLNFKICTSKIHL